MNQAVSSEGLLVDGFSERESMSEGYVHDFDVSKELSPEGRDEGCKSIVGTPDQVRMSPQGVI